MCGRTPVTVRRSWSIASGDTGRCVSVGRLGGGMRAASWLIVALWLFTAGWAAPAASAVEAGRSPTPAKVKYYVVPAAGHGPATLFEIAKQTLGSGRRYPEIFRLNKGRPQPNGRRMENPKLVEPGWILKLPHDAAGPGVHFGRLPRPDPPARSAPPSPSPSLSPSLSPSPSGSSSPVPKSSPSAPPARAAGPGSVSTGGFVIAGLVLVLAGALTVTGALVLPSRGRRRLAGGADPSRPQRGVERHVGRAR